MEKEQPREHKTRKVAEVIGRIVFSVDDKVLKVIDLDEKSIKQQNKVRIIEKELDEMVDENKITREERHNVSVSTERFPPPTFLSSTHR